LTRTNKKNISGCCLGVFIIVHDIIAVNNLNFIFLKKNIKDILFFIYNMDGPDPLLYLGSLSNNKKANSFSHK
jgi:hypothetical protein